MQDTKFGSFSLKYFSKKCFSKNHVGFPPTSQRGKHQLFFKTTVFVKTRGFPQLSPTLPAAEKKPAYSLHPTRTSCCTSFNWRPDKKGPWIRRKTRKKIAKENRRKQSGVKEKTSIVPIEDLFANLVPKNWINRLVTPCLTPHLIHILNYQQIRSTSSARKPNLVYAQFKKIWPWHNK